MISTNAIPTNAIAAMRQLRHRPTHERPPQWWGRMAIAALGLLTLAGLPTAGFARYSIMCYSDGTCMSTPADVQLPLVVIIARRVDLGPTFSPPLGGGGGRSSEGGGGGGTPTPKGDPGKPKRAEPVQTDNSKLDDCASPTAGSNPTTGNPVVIATGEKIKLETDFLSVGQYGLSHERTYRRNYSGPSMFGAYWWSSLSHPKDARQNKVSNLIGTTMRRKRVIPFAMEGMPLEIDRG